MSGGGVSPSEMPSFARRIIGRTLGAATAEELLAGRGAAPGAPASQQALARVLEIAAGPPTDRELADEAAYVAAFVLATSPAGTRRGALPPVVRMVVQLTLAVVVTLLAVGSTAAFTGQLPARIQELAHVTLGAPAPHHDSRLQSVTRFSPGHQADPRSVTAGLPIRGTPPDSVARLRKGAAARPSPPARADVRPKTQPAGRAGRRWRARE